MRFFALLFICLSACSGCGHTKPVQKLSSSTCLKWTCTHMGEKADCTCAD